jgi:hypothetical protein
MLAFVSLGTLNMVAQQIPDAELFGVELDAKTPTLSLDEIRKETFQRDATLWFEQHWGLRGYAVRTDNTVVMSLFGEARSGQAIVARNDILISSEDINYVNRDDPPEASLAQAKNIARVQSKMRSRGKALVPVIIPSKTSFFRGAVPSAWQRRGAYELADSNLYGAFVKALEAEGAVFVDGRALLAKEMRSDHVFAPTGRHWRMSAGCRVLQAALDAARPDLPELGDDRFECRTRVDPNASIEDEDYDLFRLLNVWNGKPAGIDVEVLDAPKAPASFKVPTIFVGSSFVWKFVHASRELDMLQPSLFYYYDSSVVEVTSLLVTKKVEPFTDDWRKDTFSKRLFILGMLETYIPADGEQFLSELEKELDASEPPRPASAEVR